ncbi:hypothetical protein N2152v2_006979 [Parachlorella kessleri]
MEARFAAAHCGETAEVGTLRPLVAGGSIPRPLTVSSPSSPRYSLLCLFQGQGSAEAARICSSVAVAAVEDLLPPFPASLLAGGKPAGLRRLSTGLRRLSTKSPQPQAAAEAQWEGELQAALLCAVVELQAQLGQAGCPEGCSAAVVLQVGRLVTCAVLGDVEVAVCTSTGPGAVQPGDWLELSVDHRLSSNAGERGRLLQAGARLAPRDIEENSPAPIPSRGTGGLRMWPGGLESARALGFFDVRAPGGDVVLPLPHIRQARLPPGGGRIVLATRNVWEAGAASAGQQQPQQAQQQQAGGQGDGTLPDASKSIQRALLRGRLSYCTRQVLEAAKAVEAAAGEGRELCGGAGGGSADPAAVAVVAEVRPVDGADGRLAGKAATPGCSFLGLFGGRRSSKAAAAAALAAPLNSSEPAQLLCDLDTALLMGLTTEEPPERPPAWLTLRLMGDIHSCLKRAYQSWKVIQRAALAAGFADGPVQPTLRSSARHSSSGSLQQQVTSWQSDDGAGSEHEAPACKAGKKKKKQSLGWLADVYDKRASHHMRGTTAQPSRKHGSSQSLQDAAEEGPGRGSRAGSRDTSPGRTSHASSENELSLPAPPRKVRRSVSSVAWQGSGQGMSMASGSYSPMQLGRSHSVSDAKLPPVYPRQRVSGDSVVAPQTPTVPAVTPRRPLQHASSAAARLEAAAAAAAGSAAGPNSSSPAHGRASIGRQGSAGGEMQTHSLGVSRQASMDEESIWPEARTLPRLMRTGSLPVVKVDISPKPLQPAKPRKLTRGSTLDSSANSHDSVGSKARGGSESEEGEVAAEEVAAASGALALFYKNSESRKERGKVQTRI